MVKKLKYRINTIFCKNLFLYLYPNFRVMLMRRFLLLSALLPLLWQSASAKLYINEIMQSNIDCLFAECEYPDSWVEIYNDAETGSRMPGLRIGLTDDFESAYPIPISVGFPAHGHVVIYCDKLGTARHADFRIDSGKGELYLFASDGSIIDYVKYSKMPAPNVSYGRETDMSDNWGYQLTPSPGEENTSGITSIVLPDPVFSTEGETMVGINKTIRLTISIPDDVVLPDDTRLYYTLDGTEPTTDSEFTDSSVHMEFARTKVIRAKLISSQAVSPRSVTHSYISHVRKTDLPILSIAGNSNDFYDSQIGIYNHIDYEWRRPINVEYFPTANNGAVINQLAECRVHGGWTRNLPQKSLALYANKRFGEKRFNYQIWPDKTIDESKSFIIRNGGNSFGTARIKDSFIQTLFGRHCPNLDWQAYQPAIVYFNGEYRGLYGIRERSNEDYVEANYDGLEEIDMIENWNELKAGTWDSFYALRDLYNNNPTYAQMAEAIDVENFINLYIANTWATNTDFPGNNMVMWRPQEEGGKWRWIMKDLDFLAANDAWYKYFSFLLRTGSHTNDSGEGNRREAVKIFQVMTNFSEFRNLLVSHFMVYLGDFLRESVVSDLIEEQRNALADEYESHLKVYGYPNSVNGWHAEVDHLKDWCRRRTENLPSIIRDYLSLGELVPVSVIGNGEEITINNVAVTQEDFVGYWNEGKLMQIRCANPDFSWKVTTTGSDGNKKEVMTSSPIYRITPTSSTKAIKLEAIRTSDIEAAESSAIRIFSAGSNVIVEAAEGIESVVVADIAGRIVAESSSDAFIFRATLSPGVYVVTATDATGSTSTKKIAI